MPQPTARCLDLACLEANEGNVVEVEGTFAFPRDPRRKGQHLYRLSLTDGTSLVLPAPPAGEFRRRLSRDNDGKQLTVRGRIYTKTIPEQYGIIERTADPYCVELFDVKVAP